MLPRRMNSPILRRRPMRGRLGMLWAPGQFGAQAGDLGLRGEAGRALLLTSRALLLAGRLGLLERGQQEAGGRVEQPEPALTHHQAQPERRAVEFVARYRLVLLRGVQMVAL